MPGGPCSEAYRGFKPREYMPLSLEQNLELSSNRSRTGGVQLNGPYPDDPAGRHQHKQTLRGAGCEEVTRVHTDGADVILGKWKGGRTGEIRAVRPDSDYGVLVFRAGGKVEVVPKIDDSYRPLVAEIVKFFETKRPTVPNEETLEVIEFMDAAQRSLSLGGAPVKLR